MKEKAEEMPKKILPPAIATVINAQTHFEVLGLPLPEPDEGGLPIWGVADTKIQRQYRVSSLKVHPDKHRSFPDEAKEAFDKVSQARDCLLDIGLREAYLREYGLKLRQNNSSSWSLHPSFDLV